MLVEGGNFQTDAFWGTLSALFSHHVGELFWEPSRVIVKFWAAMGSVGGSDCDENALGGIVMKGSF